MKSAILAGGAAPPRSHDVVELLALVVPDLPPGDALRAAAVEISAVSPARRYPGDLPEPTVEEARSLRNAAALILEFARERLSPPA